MKLITMKRLFLCVLLFTAGCASALETGDWNETTIEETESQLAARAPENEDCSSEAGESASEAGDRDDCTPEGSNPRKVIEMRVVNTNHPGEVRVQKVVHKLGRLPEMRSFQASVDGGTTWHAITEVTNGRNNQGTFNLSYGVYAVAWR